MKKVLVSLVLMLAIACGTATPIASLYVTGQELGTLKFRANAVIAQLCPNSIVSDPQKLASCQQMATDNALAQASVTEAVKVARVAIAAGDKEAYEVAIITLTQALCSVAVIVPGITVKGLDTSTCVF